MLVVIQRRICFFARSPSCSYQEDPAQQQEEEEQAGEQDDVLRESLPVTIKVDLDGTIAEPVSGGVEEIGPPRPGAREVLSRWKARNWRIIINTVRGNHAQVESYLRRHRIPFDYINYNPDQPPNSSHKIYADVDVDDTAVDADRPWEEIDRAVCSKLLRQGKIGRLLTSLLCKQAKKEDGFAPGIADRHYYGRPLDFPGEEATFVLQRHLALRAGPHYDVRFGGPEGLFSWATRKEWPAEPARILLFQQPMHSWKYKDFEGTIPSGTYGAGEVRKQLETRMKILRRGRHAITFQLPDHLPHLEYSLIELPRQPQSRRQLSRPWLLIVRPTSSGQPELNVVPRRQSVKRPLSRQEAQQLRAEAARVLEPYVLHLATVGSVLRHPQQEAFGDLDLLVIPKEEIPVRLRRQLRGRGVDLYTADMASFEPSLLHWGLGKRILQLKAIAKRHGMRLNQYGLWQQDEQGKWRLAETDAEEIFRRLKNLDRQTGQLPDFLRQELENFRQLRKQSQLALLCRRCGRWPEDCLCQGAAMILEPYWRMTRR